MPVMTKTKHEELVIRLQTRYATLFDVFKPRELKNNGEGLSGRRHYVSPESMCGTRGDAMEIRMAVEDFKTILAEIKRL